VKGLLTTYLLAVEGAPERFQPAVKGELADVVLEPRRGLGEAARSARSASVGARGWRTPAK
jgi:hypothetical protein